MERIQGIYALCDTTFCPQKPHGRLAEELLAGGIKILQLRMKGEKDADRVRQSAVQILRLKKKYDFTFILNDFVDIAIEVGADGIHVGQDDLALPQLLEKTHGKILVGYSSHSLGEALKAEADGAHYVALGAIFPTSSKGPGHPVVGISTLKQVLERLKVPVVAIGGINKNNFLEVKETGVDAIAMIGALTAVENVPAAAGDFTCRWKADRS